MGTATMTTPRPAPSVAPAAAPTISAAELARRIRIHLDAAGPTPEARYYAATGRYPCDD